MNVSTTAPRWAYLSECDSPPDGWSVVPFTCIATVIAGQSPPSGSYNREQEGLPFLQGNGEVPPVAVPLPMLDPEPSVVPGVGAS